MGSSKGGGGNPAALSMAAAPMPGLPIAGKDSTIGNPFEYGKFQNFLPDIPAAGEGPAPSATGLTKEMFLYRSPSGVVEKSAGPGADEISSLRDALAKMQEENANNNKFAQDYMQQAELQRQRDFASHYKYDND